MAGIRTLWTLDFQTASRGHDWTPKGVKLRRRFTARPQEPRLMESRCPKSCVCDRLQSKSAPRRRDRPRGCRATPTERPGSAAPTTSRRGRISTLTARRGTSYSSFHGRIQVVSDVERRSGATPGPMRTDSRASDTWALRQISSLFGLSADARQ